MQFKIKLDVFNYYVYFYVGKEEKEKFIKDLNLEVLEEDVRGYVYGNSVWVEDGLNINALVHECHHAKHELTKTRGINDEEAEAYILAFLVEEALKKISRRLKNEQKLEKTIH